MSDVYKEPAWFCRRCGELCSPVVTAAHAKQRRSDCCSASVRRDDGAPTPALGYVDLSRFHDSTPEDSMTVEELLAESQR